MNGSLFGFFTPLFYLGCVASIVYFSKGTGFDSDLLSFRSVFHGVLVVVMPSIWKMSFVTEEMEDEKTALLGGMSSGCMLGFVLVNMVPGLGLGNREGLCHGGHRLLEAVVTVWGW